MNTLTSLTYFLYKNRLKTYKNIDFPIESYIKAIDIKNIKILKSLINTNDNNLNKIDIVLEIFNQNLLTRKRLNFIIENCTECLYISSSLIKKLIKEDNTRLLDIIFSHIRFFDNEFILNLLIHYKNQMPIKSAEFNRKIKYYEIYKNKNEAYLSNMCERGNKYAVKYLVKHGADVNKRDCDGNLPLTIACKNGNEKIVKYLIKHRAKINQLDYRPLHYPNSTLYLDGKTPLIYACEKGYENIVKYLIEHGADVNYKNPLGVAYENEQENIVKYLVEHGADVNKSDNSGNLPLINACTNGNENMVKYLIEHGADVNKSDRHDNLPLIIACKNEHENIVKYLIEHGADVNNSDRYNNLSLVSVCTNGNEKYGKIFN